jgi:hypothetical protein
MAISLCFLLWILASIVRGSEKLTVDFSEELLAVLDQHSESHSD